MSVYLGNRVTVDRTRQNVVLDQTEFVSELLDRFGMKDSTPVPTPMVARLSNVNAGEKLESKEHELYITQLWEVCFIWPAGRGLI